MKKLPKKFNQALPVNELANTLVMRHFILLVLKLKSAAYNSGSKANYRVLATNNIHATWSQC